ncbi:hypothetical protein MVEN_02521000 [Mycena venus]|uniref:HMG box domain-containing protein n=1 Tax=Mycena venus TaxID=2733690 RepID=A0A8H6WUL5_9AGAR|nr:hypothetical protein MVEN_02521000 [Mycena venus]
MRWGTPARRSPPAMPAASLSPSDSSALSCSSPSEASSPRPIVLSEDLPLPTVPRPFSTKKSHAKKQPLGHIPRPRNAFILFRCDYGRQNERKMREHDQNDISRMVGTIWRNMTEEQRAPWVHLAEAEKKRHATLYPGYKYTPRNKRSKPTEKEVEQQIAKEAEKSVQVELVKRVTETNSKEMVTVYYPPWATRRTLTYFARRATSCPPEGAVSVEPYSEMMDRAMVTTNAKVEDVKQDERPDKEEAPPRKTAEDVFVPSAYGICYKDSSASSESPLSRGICADHSLSQDTHTIDPPGGTSSWGEEAPSSSEYPQNAHDTFHYPERLYIPPFFYLPQGDLAMSQYSYAGPPASGESGNTSDHGNYWPLRLPALSPSPTDTSPAASPVTPTEHSAFLPTAINDEGGQYGEAPSSGKFHAESFTNSEGQEEFLSEFGNIFQPASGVYDGDDTFGAGVNITPRESSMRTTYASYEGLYTQQ